MSYNKNVDADYIKKFAKRQEEEWGPQRKDDLRVFNLLTGKDELDVAEPVSQAGKVVVRPLRTGRPGVASDRNAAILSQPPTNRVNPLDPNDQESKKHADSVLEPFLDQDWRLSQIGNVYFSQTKDLGDYSRGWSNKFPLPRLWASNEYVSMTEEMVTLNDKRADAEGEDAKKIDAERKALQKRIDDFLAENYPLRWRALPARFVWPEWSDERYLPEVVELRKMKCGRIAAEYGDILPERYESHGSTELDVYVYHNYYCTKTVICGNGGEDELYVAREWEHELGMNPCVLMETNIILDEPGKRWKPPLLDHADMLEAENELLSDIRHNHRRNTLAGPKITIDPLTRGIDEPKTAASLGRAIEYKVGEPLFLLKGEEEALQSVPVVNPQSVQLLEFVAAYNSEIVLNPVEAGRMLSGQAAVGFATALQAAQTRLDPYAIAINDGVRMLDKLTFRCVECLDRLFNGLKISVTANRGMFKGQTIKVGAKEVEGWENQVQPRLSIMLPINRNANMDLAVTAQNLTLPPDFILEDYLNIEDASGKIQGWIQWQIMQALIQNLTIATQERAGEIAQQPGGTDIQTLAQNIANMPPEALLPMGANINGQSIANSRQAGVPQATLSETAAQQVY